MTYWTQLLHHRFSVEQVDVGGISTRVMTMGSGEPIIFLHGISGHLEAFIPMAPYLADFYELHLIDMLGHGFTDKPSEPIEMPNMAAHILGYMDMRGIEKAHIVGISMGGWLTGWLLGHHPERCLSSIMIAAAGNPAMGKPEIGELVRRITSAGVLSEDRQQTVERLQAVMFNADSLDDELVDSRYTIYHLPEFRANLDNLLAMTYPERYAVNRLTPESLRGVQQEVLLCWGEDDKNSGVADADFLTDYLPNSKLVQMANTGHWPPYERPEDFAKLARSFFEQGLNAVQEGRF
ncbi:alpha/beta hydrolase [Sphingobium sp. MK2]|uniref:alpha/beta fold hydrolase n=1 Tax=Sphingobium sp. MK2 TaxID=3116540 RepID=UPI0032E3679F